jgi:hypothetical protein
VALSSVRLPNCFPGLLAGMLSANLRAHDPIAENALSRPAAHGPITAVSAATGNPLDFGSELSEPLRVSQLYSVTTANKTTSAALFAVAG